MNARTGLKATLTGLAALAALMVLPGVAVASTASTSFDDLSFSAGPGETNNLTVSLEGANYILNDPGAPITPMAGCAAVNANRVACTAALVTGRIEVELGNMNDQVLLEASLPELPNTASINGEQGNDVISSLGPYRIRAFGGDGNDVIAGGTGSDRLEGEAGNDVIAGNEGNDQFLPGPGDDTVDGGPGFDDLESSILPDGADTFNGGDGRDYASYRSRIGPVTVTLDGVAGDGEPGEGDNIGTDIERLDGGSADDVLVGNGLDNDIGGGPGEDSITGGGGDDDLNGDDGNDLVSGEAGNDDVEGDDGADSISGGEGNDVSGREFFDGAPDQISGGGGLDLYRDSSLLGLRIDLDGTPDDGYANAAEGPAIDNINADFENIDTSDGISDDILTGNDLPNQIDGGGGDDQISGLDGPDGLIGGPGDDSLDGGNGVDELEGQGGSDALRSRDRSPDEVDCGSAIDTLLADPLDVFTVTCDASSIGARITSNNAKLNRKGKAKVKVVCPAVEGINCKVRLAVKKGKKTLAKGSGKVKSGRSGKLTLKLTKAGKKATHGSSKRSKGLKLTARTTLTDAAGAKVTTKRKLVLKH